MSTQKISDRRRRFIDEYCLDFNATAAAKRSGYSESTAYSQGQRLLKIVEIRREIDKKLEELAMPANEALARLGDMAAASFDHFIVANDNGDVVLDLSTERAKAHYHLIKKIKQSRVTTGSDDYEREEIRTELELYSAQSAIVDMLKIYGKFNDGPAYNVNLNLSDLSDEQLDRVINGESLKQVIGNTDSGGEREEKAETSD